MTTRDLSALPFGRVITIVLVLLTALITLPLGTSGQAPAPAPRLDLAALVLQPADLEAEGQPGYGKSNGEIVVTVDEMTDPSRWLDSRAFMYLADVPDAASTLTAAGWQRYHELVLAVPLKQSSKYSVSAISSIEMYASPEGAATAFAALTTEEVLKSGHDGEMAILPGGETGDESVVSRHQFTVSDLSGFINVVTQMVRIDTMIVSVTLVDWGHNVEPDPTLAERLTARVVDRVQAARDSGVATPPCLPVGPGATGSAIAADHRSDDAPLMMAHGHCVQILSGGGFGPYKAQYRAIDGVITPLFRMDDEDVAHAQAVITDDGLLHSYQFAQAVTDGWETTVYIVTITTFRDVAAATAHFASAEQWLAEETGADVQSVVRNPVAIGDESFNSIVYFPDSRQARTGVATRFGNTMVSVNILRTHGSLPSLETVTNLLTSQVACMEANDCSTPLPAPQDLLPDD